MLKYIEEFEKLGKRARRTPGKNRFNPICPHPSGTKKEKE